jgi:hypothetical protein
MPNIKVKAFALPSVLCYSCGREIKQGDLNWTFNPHKSAMFKHRNCLLNENQFKQSLDLPKTPEPIEDTHIEEINLVENDDSPTEDITDLITTSGKHKMTSLIKTVFAMREYPFLFGAPGAGKTHLMLTIASDMKLDFVNISCANDMFKSELLGSVSPVSGNFYATSFYNAWENGGLILLDEVGLASGAFLNVLNAGLAQREIRFPNGKRVRMNDHCFISFADNSALYGNDPMFPERQDAGQAFRDRITYIKFEYDEELERRIIADRFGGRMNQAVRWHRCVLALRAEIASLDVPVFVSPRFAYAAAKAFTHGLSYDEIIEMYLMRGLNGDIHRLTMPIIEKYRGSY